MTVVAVLTMLVRKHILATEGVLIKLNKLPMKKIIFAIFFTGLLCANFLLVAPAAWGVDNCSSYCSSGAGNINCMNTCSACVSACTPNTLGYSTGGIDNSFSCSNTCYSNAATPPSGISPDTSATPITNSLKSSGLGGSPSTSTGSTPASTAPGELPNPLGINDIRVVIGNVIKAVLGIVGSLALVMFMYGGFLWMFSQGEMSKVKKGLDTMIWAAAGLALIFGSYIVVGYILTSLTGAGK